jgi:hypothetical protein
MATLAGTGDAAVLSEDEPDGAGGARQTQAKRLELRIVGQEIQDGFGTRGALQMSGRGITNGEDTLDDEGVKARRRLNASARAAVKDEIIVGGSSAEASAPLLDPGEGAMSGSGVVLEGPGGLEVKQ